MSRITRTTLALLAVFSVSAAVASCGGGTESGADEGRNAALVAGTACRTAGKYTKVSGQKVVCGSTRSGKLWYPVAKVKKTKCAKSGQVRKNQGVAFVCGVTKSSRVWMSTRALGAVSNPADVSAQITLVAQTLERTDPAADATKVAAPDDVVRIMPVESVNNGSSTSAPPAAVTPTTKPPFIRRPVSEQSFSSVAVGVFSTCGVLTNGAVVCWGDNTVGQLGDGTTAQASIPVYSTWFDGIDHKATSIATVWGTSFCAVDTAGAVFCWGGNDYGQLGNGTFAPSAQAVAVPRLDGVAVKVARLTGAEGQFCAVDEARMLWCWGGGGLAGRFGAYEPRVDSYPRPTNISGLAKVVVRDVAISASAVCATDVQASLWCWGNNSAGLLGSKFPQDTTPQPAFRVPGIGTADKEVPVSRVWANSYSMCIVNQTGEVRCWGIGAYSGLGTDRVVTSPTRINMFDGGAAASVMMEGGGLGMCAFEYVKKEQWCWGLWNPPADGQPVVDATPRRVSDALKVPANVRVSFSLTNIGVIDGSRLSMFGQNWAGQLGNGTISS